MVETTGKGSPLARGRRLQIMLDDEELEALDNFRFERRMPSRAAAVRELLKQGFAAAANRPDRPGGQPIPFGVAEASSESRKDG